MKSVERGLELFYTVNFLKLTITGDTKPCKILFRDIGISPIGPNGMSLYSPDLIIR